MRTKRLQTHHKFLKAVRDGSKAQAKNLLFHSSPNQQKAVGEILHNVVHGFSKIDKKTLTSIKPYRRILAKYIDPTTTNSERHKIATMRGGGMLGSVMKKVLSRGARRSVVRAAKRRTSQLMRNKKLRRQITNVAKKGLKPNRRVQSVERAIVEHEPAPAVYKRPAVRPYDLQLRIDKIDRLLEKYAED